MQLNVIITSVLSYYFSDYLVFHHVECFLFVARRRVLFTVIYSIFFFLMKTIIGIRRIPRPTHFINNFLFLSRFLVYFEQL